MKYFSCPIHYAWKLGPLLALASVSFSLSAQEASSSTVSFTPDHGIEAYVSEDALQALYVRQADIGEFGEVDIRAGVFFNERRDLVTVADLLSEIVDPERFPRWTFRIGPRMYGAMLNDENQDVFSIGFGGEARYEFGARRIVAVQLSGFYAPDILTFGEADNVTDVSVRLEMQLRERLQGFVGYRSFEFDLPQSFDREVDDGLHIGIRRSF